jgi:hypothetical protein
MDLRARSAYHEIISHWVVVHGGLAFFPHENGGMNRRPGLQSDCMWLFLRFKVLRLIYIKVGLISTKIGITQC